MKNLFTRRKMLLGAGGVVIVAAAAFEGSRLFRKRYAPSPYDDLMALLDDRDADAQVGEAVLSGNNAFDPKKTAKDVRERIGKRPLAQVMIEDAKEGRVLEADGWVIPETLALLCALAAKTVA